MQLNLNAMNAKAHKNALVVIEAKHYVTADKINAKVRQVQMIEEYLQQARKVIEMPASDVRKEMKVFRKNVHQFQFHKFAPRVYLYIGGTLWSDDAWDAMQALAATDPEHIGAIAPWGQRYSVADVHINFKFMKIT